MFVHHLTDRPRVSFPSANEPITEAEQQNKSKHRTRVVHVKSSHRLLWRKGEKNADEDAVYNREEIEVQSERPQSEWSVTDRLPLNFPKSKKDNRDQIRDVQGKGGQGKDRVERRGRCDVDEA